MFQNGLLQEIACTWRVSQDLDLMMDQDGTFVIVTALALCQWGWIMPPPKKKFEGPAIAEGPGFSGELG